MALTITDLFNDATTREIGGVGPDQVNAIVSDLIGVQQGLNAAFPQVTDLTSLHAQIIANQLNEEIASVENANSPTGTPVLGTNLGQYVGRAINDIHRDIIDIAQGDPGLQAVFNPTPLPALNTPPAPFLDNATQTAFMTQFIQDSNHLGQAAITIENNGFNGDTAGLIQQIQTFEQNANAFDQSQGGLWSARFWNELRSDGTAGTAANALIDGLQTHNAGEVNAAAQQLAMNASDVGGNNLMQDGGNYASVIAAAHATDVTPATTVAGAGASAGAGTGTGTGAGAGTGTGTGAGAGTGTGTGAATGTGTGTGAGTGTAGTDTDSGTGTTANADSNGGRHHDTNAAAHADWAAAAGALADAGAHAHAADTAHINTGHDHTQFGHMHFGHMWG
jgi:hypothetical protein